MPSFADIYASCLYEAGEGLPLWNPSPLRLGDVGYVRDGSFIVLYNAVDGPEALSDAASIRLARRFDRSLSRDRARRGSNADTRMEVDDPIQTSAPTTMTSRRSSLAVSTVSTSSATACLSKSAASDSLLPTAAKKGSPTLSHRKLRSSTPPEGPYPPMPLSVDQEEPKLFDMGPRMSSNYRCLGVNLGASVPGAPVSAKIGFESLGGDGAILVPRDPTERTRLKYLGVLKAYIKAHHKWMYETYGRIEAIGIDHLALIYGQDRTSDWAVAVSRDTARGARVEFEICNSAHKGFWGNWSHTLSACQRGPHRPPVVPRDRAAGSDTTADSQSTIRNVNHVRASLEHKHDDDDQRTWGMHIDTGVVNASFSFTPPSSKSQHDDEQHTRGRRRSPQSRAHRITWSEVHAPPDQTISIRRVTACTSLGLGFLPARPKAAAEPRDPDYDGEQDHENAPVAGEDTIQASSRNKQWCDDPLEALHEWIHERGGTKVKVSIASDDDCLRLLALLGGDHTTCGLQKAVRMAADRFAHNSVDADGFATVSFHSPSILIDRRAAVVCSAPDPALSALQSRMYTAAPCTSSTLDKGNSAQNLFAAVRRPTSLASSSVASKTPRAPASSKPRVMLPSARSNVLLPCRPMHGIGSASPSLVLS
ncbi:hypothetical protein NDA17_003520 [Ustilago hordei]|nr:hypothetical protein NDA17_003520 [Ustilago hordei]